MRPYAIVGLALARRRSRHTGCRGAGALPHRQQDDVQRSRYFAAAGDRTSPGPRFARTATNAAKHGALSSPNGKITLDWKLQGDALTLHWVENGGPRIAQPSSRSFGLKVIIGSIEQQLGGKASFDWDTKGLRCKFSIPCSELTKSRALHQARNGSAINGAVIGLDRRTSRACFLWRTRPSSP